jgi:plastocyanin
VSVSSGSSSLVRRRGAALVLAVAAGLLSACGGGNTGSSSAASSSTSSSAAADTSTGAGESSGSGSAAAQALTVTEQNFKIQLASSTLAAGDYTITIDNQDQATHDLRIEKDGQTIAASDVIQPGGSGTLTVTLEPGSYVFYCGVGAHRANGMETDVDVS